MYESREEEYTFCPECGALTRNGVCPNCGCQDPKVQDCRDDSPVRNASDQPSPAPGGSVPDCPPEADGQPEAGDSMQNGADFGFREGPGCGPQNNAGYGPQSGPGYGSPRNGAGYGGQNGWSAGPQNGGFGAQNGQGQPYGPYGAPQSGMGYDPQNRGGYGPYGWGPDRRDNGRILIAVLITISVMLFCVVMLLMFLLLRTSVKTAVISGEQQEQQPSVPGPEDGLEEWYGQLPEAPSRGSSPETEPEEEYVPSAEDDYYETLANAVRDDLSYSIEWEEYDLSDEETGATAVGRYPQLTGGNIPQVEELNALIESEATYFRTLYDYYRSWQGDNVVYNVESTGYVTYMDEDKISIVLKESYVMDGQSSISLYSINIDLLSGKVMDNGKIIEYNRQLAEEFRRQNDYQNGQVDAVESMDDEQLLDFLSDENTNIVFYTPVGLEIGFNYTTSDSSGWVTATIKDYERYVEKL